MCAGLQLGNIGHVPRSRLVALVLLAALVTAGCSDSAEPAGTSARPMGPPRNPPAAASDASWVEQVCRAVAPVAGPAPPPAVGIDDLLGSRERILAYLDQRATALRGAYAALGDVGPAPTQAGQSSIAPASQVLDQRAMAVSGVAEGLRAVPAVAEGTLADALRRAQSELVLADRGVVLTDLALPPQLQQTATGIPACRSLVA